MLHHSNGCWPSSQINEKHGNKKDQTSLVPVSKNLKLKNINKPSLSCSHAGKLTNANYATMIKYKF